MQWQKPTTTAVLKKYQWTTIPLSLIGTVVKEKRLEIVEVNIGEDEDDPVFTITDLLPPPRG
ncbi:MAG: hypothetical protein L6V93_13495 [Clostridiales bacterium]|nr:MAG: hypothetical protein L6V93_13495 [Clostridiales bacterium]